jgi:hypothetical protein
MNACVPVFINVLVSCLKLIVAGEHRGAISSKGKYQMMQQRDHQKHPEIFHEY